MTGRGFTETMHVDLVGKKFFIRTYGCQMNVRDSEAVAASLLAMGMVASEQEDDADLILVNSCSVREKAEDKAIGKLGLTCATKRERPGRIVGLMGCMAQRLGDSVFKQLPALDFSVGTRRNGAIPRLVREAFAGGHNLLEVSAPDDVPDAPDGHCTPGFSAFVTILLGCNRRCSYCIVPDVRGREWSRPAREIVAEVETLARRGVKEVTLLGQSVMNYGRLNAVWAEDDAPSPRGFQEPFARLLEAVAAVPGIARVRFTSGHPSGVTDELVRALATVPHLCHHLHLPVQSGSNRVLKSMRRGYTRQQYLAACAKLRAAMPDFVLTTDVIVGYPTETADEFEETRTLLEEAAFGNAFIFKFSPRPGTPAAEEMEDDVSDEEKCHRDEVLLADQDVRGQRLNEALIGSVQEVLAEGPSLRNASRWSGRTGGNKIVVFEPEGDLQPSELVSVKITDAKPQTLYGKLVRA